jgi:aminoglycoside phosphotransferase (APT) family kinase protein
VDDDPAAAIARVAMTHLGTVAPPRVVAFGRGGDHAAYLVDDRIVVRRALTGEMDVEREARLLALVAEVSPVPVPRPLFVAADERCLAYELLDGVPLLGVARPASEAVAAELGRLLRALNAVHADRLRGLVERDEVDGDELLRDAAHDYGAVAAAIPPPYRPAVEAFLGAPPPPPATRLAFTHNDLGIEHVLVDPAGGAITGVIDWSDAAFADPDYDLGLIYRDLGPRALDAALAALAYDEPGIRARAEFHARCALLEDLAFGLANDRPEYADKSLAGLAWLFAADP